MSNRIMTELEAGGNVYDIHGKAIVNSNGSNSGAPYVFDWIGTQQQYNDQQIEQNHPDWVCYITDDVEGGTSVYTKTEADNKFVTKATAETISGEKHFTVNFHRKNTSITRGTAPQSATYQDINFTDKDNKWLAGFEHEVKNTKESVLHMILSDMVNNTTNTKIELKLIQASDGTAYCELPADTRGTTIKATTFDGTANRALWADLAENYKTDEKYPIGTLIKFGGEQDITVADNKCNGVISDKPGYVLDSQLENSLPVALAGKTPVRIIGKVHKFDNITLSEVRGIGRVAKEGETVIAKALESSDDENEKLIMCVTKFNLD